MSSMVKFFARSSIYPPFQQSNPFNPLHPLGFLSYTAMTTRPLLLLVALTFLVILAPCARAADYAVRMTTYYTGDPNAGEIDAGDITPGDIYTLLFTLDENVLSLDGGGYALFESAMTNIQFLRDPGNTGTYVPSPSGITSSLTLTGDSSSSQITFNMFSTGSNTVSYHSLDYGDGSAFLNSSNANFATNEGFNLGGLPEGTALSDYLSAYATPITGWAPINSNMNFTGTTVDVSALADPQIQSIPEPSTWALMGIGAIGIAMRLRRKSSAA
jgi:hypothetical protein